MNKFPFGSSLAFALIFVLISCQDKNSSQFEGWTMVGGNATGNKYSSLTQLDTTNVQQLEVAWTYHTGDADTAAHSQIQCNPIVVNGVLYGTSPQLKLFALDAATGKERWSFSPFDTLEGDRRAHFNLNNNRGIRHWALGRYEELNILVIRSNVEGW